jgi:hypothetical protein
MKKIILLTAFSMFVGVVSFGQYFQATFTNIGSVVYFKIKPTSNITTTIGYIEIAFRYDTTISPSFPIGAIANNTTAFPGLNMVERQDYDLGNYKYVRFLFTSTISSAAYTAGTEYDLFNITLNGPPTEFATLELASDLSTTDPNNYYFYMIAGDAVTPLVDPNGNPTTDPVLYGAGHYVSGTGEFVPLTNVPVPVKFTGFSVVKKDDKAILNWAVENEGPTTDHYEIERSFNGVDFVKVANVPIKGNGNFTNNTYSYSDDNLSLLKSSGTIYYRIIQFDKNGSSLSTDIRAVRLGSGVVITAYPNPVKNIFSVTIELDVAAPISMNISDASGKLIQQLQLQGTKGINYSKIDLSKFASGSYLLKVNSGTEITTLPIVKE